MSFDINKPYRTRDGFAAHAVPGPDGRLYGWRESDFPNGRATLPCVWNGDGSHGWNGDADLVNIHETRTVKVWINVYEGGTLGLALQPSRDEADLICRSGKRIACIEREITYTVGEGLGDAS